MSVPPAINSARELLVAREIADRRLGAAKYAKGTIGLPLLRQPFDRRNCFALVHHRQRETRVDPFAVNENGTRAALSKRTAFLCPGEMKPFTQRVDQCRSRVDLHTSARAIDLEHYVEILLSCPQFLFATDCVSRIGHKLSSTRSVKALILD